MKFKSEHTFEQRKAESERVRAKYPDRIPGEIVRNSLAGPSIFLYRINLLYCSYM